LGSHDAIGPTAGILYQFERLLFQLSGSGQDSIVGIEAGDDIVVKNQAGIALEQDKHSLQGEGHPFEDRSLALWKTLSNWLEASSEEQYRDARLYLVTNRPVPDCLAKRLGGDDKSPESLSVLISDLRQTGFSPSDSIARYAVRLTSATDLELAHLIRRITLFDDSESPDQGLRAKIISALRLPGHLDCDIVIERLLGWLHRVVMEKWKAGVVAWVAVQSFSNQLFATLKSIERQRVLERPERLIPISDDDRTRARMGGFVRHLSLTSCSEAEVDRAVDDFIRFCVEYSRLLEEGDIHPLDWDDRGQRLHRRWESICRRVASGRGDAPSEDVGRDVYRETIEHRERLAGFETQEYYLTSGHYQRLADSDEVWWNPDYPMIIKRRGVA
jgi:hypothetical protein